MKRFLAAMLAAMVVSGAPPVAADEPQVPPHAGNGPFELVPLPHAPQRSKLGSTLAFVAGAGMIAGSFAVAHRADDAYDRYLQAKTPSEIEHWFDRAARYDRWSSGALIGGEALVATGVYLRFLRRGSSPVSLVLASRACAVSLRF